MTVLFFMFAIAGIVATVVVKNLINRLTKKMDQYLERGSYYKQKAEEEHNKILIMQKLKKISLVICGSGMVLSLVFACFFTVNEQHTAIVITFGKPEAVTDTGLHFKIPFVQKIKRVDTTIQGMAIGYDSENDEAMEEDSLMITSDFNFVNVDFYIEYKVTDAIQYLYGSKEPEGILKNLAQSSIRNTIGLYTVDAVLTTGKSEIQSAIKDDIIKELQKLNTGLSLVNITIQDAEPPTQEVLDAFQAVERAKQDADTAVNNAETYKNQKIPEADANADEILRNAEATRQERIDEANGEVALFNAMFDEYVKQPEISKIRMYYEAMEELLPNLKIIVNGTESEIKPIIIQENNQTTEQQSKNIVQPGINDSNKNMEE